MLDLSLRPGLLSIKGKKGAGSRFTTGLLFGSPSLPLSAYDPAYYLESAGSLFTTRPTVWRQLALSLSPALFLRPSLLSEDSWLSLSSTLCLRPSLLSRERRLSV
jgi:hypothetical protein